MRSNKGHLLALNLLSSKDMIFQALAIVQIAITAGAQTPRANPTAEVDSEFFDQLKAFVKQNGYEILRPGNANSSIRMRTPKGVFEFVENRAELKNNPVELRLLESTCSQKISSPLICRADYRIRFSEVGLRALNASPKNREPITFGDRVERESNFSVLLEENVERYFIPRDTIFTCNDLSSFDSRRPLLIASWQVNGEEFRNVLLDQNERRLLDMPGMSVSVDSARKRLIMNRPLSRFQTTNPYSDDIREYINDSGRIIWQVVELKENRPSLCAMTWATHLNLEMGFASSSPVQNQIPIRQGSRFPKPDGTQRSEYKFMDYEGCQNSRKIKQLDTFDRFYLDFLTGEYGNSEIEANEPKKVVFKFQSANREKCLFHMVIKWPEI